MKEEMATKKAIITKAVVKDEKAMKMAAKAEEAMRKGNKRDQWLIDQASDELQTIVCFRCIQL